MSDFDEVILRFFAEHQPLIENALDAAGAKKSTSAIRGTTYKLDNYYISLSPYVVGGI